MPGEQPGERACARFGRCRSPRRPSSALRSRAWGRIAGRSTSPTGTSPSATCCRDGCLDRRTQEYEIGYGFGDATTPRSASGSTTAKRRGRAPVRRAQHRKLVADGRARGSPAVYRTPATQVDLDDGRVAQEPGLWAGAVLVLRGSDDGRAVGRPALPAGLSLPGSRQVVAARSQLSVGVDVPAPRRTAA